MFNERRSAHSTTIPKTATENPLQTGSKVVIRPTRDITAKVGSAVAPAFSTREAAAAVTLAARARTTATAAAAAAGRGPAKTQC